MVYKKEILEFGDFSEQILTRKVKDFEIETTKSLTKHS
jgi:hypothetical protein